ncbi:16743_t:CDS:2, partial [Funneliformis geosporum]
MADKNNFHEFLNEQDVFTSSGDFNQIIFGGGIGIPDPPPKKTPGNIAEDADSTALLTTQLLVAIPLGAISLLVFCYLRTRWNAMFAPRSRLQKLAPDPLPTTFFGWIIPLYNMPESHILERVGLDAAVLLAFFKMSYKLFTFCAIVGFVVVGPIKLSKYLDFFPDGNKDGKNSFDNGPNPQPIDETPETAGELASYVILTWVFSLATFYFTFYNYLEFSNIRHKYYLKWKDTIAARTVMVTVIPKELQNDPALADFYESLGFGAVESAVVYRNVRKLRHAIGKRAKYLQKLEEAYVDYLNNPCKDPNYKPEEALKGFEKADDAKTANDNAAQVLSKVSAKRPTKLLSLFGDKVDKVEYYTQKYFEYDNLVEVGRQGAYSTSSIGFVTFENITSAQLASQVLIHSEPFKCRTELAPEPRDIYWYNMSIRTREMIVRNVIVNVLIFLLVFFWSGPISLFASLLSIKTLEKFFPWLAHLAEKNEALKDFIQGTLPTLAVSLFNALLPKIMIFLSKLQGFHARSTIELSTFAKYYFFLLINVLLIFSIVGSVVKNLEEISRDLPGIAYKLATTLPQVSSFFVNFVVIQGIGLFPIHLLQLKEVAYTWTMRVFFSKTPRDYAKATAPPFLDYGEELPPVILIFVIIIVYSSLTPIITFFGAIYFFLGYMCYKYLLLYVYFHPYETAGLAWPKIFRRIIIGLYIYQIMMIGYLSLRKYYYFAASVFPVLVCTFFFFYYVNGAYERASAFIPMKKLREELNKVQTNTSDVTITPKAPETPGSANEFTNTDGPPAAKNEDDIEEGHSHRDVLEDDLYHADPDLYTDYSQPPMSLYDGVLNTGMRNYGPPTLVGILPWLWLPVKRVPSDEDATPGFFHRLLGMNKTGSKPITSRSSRASLGETEEERIQRDLHIQEIADSKIKLATKRAIRDPNNPNRIYYHHPERRRSTLVSPISPITSGGPSNIFSNRSVRMSSPERSEIISRDIPIASSSTLTDSTPIEIPGSENLHARPNRRLTLTDKFGKLAG